MAAKGGRVTWHVYHVIYMFLNRALDERKKRRFEGTFTYCGYSGTSPGSDAP